MAEVKDKQVNKLMDESTKEKETSNKKSKNAK